MWVRIVCLNWVGSNLQPITLRILYPVNWFNSKLIDKLFNLEDIIIYDGLLNQTWYLLKQSHWNFIFASHLLHNFWRLKITLLRLDIVLRLIGLSIFFYDVDFLVRVFLPCTIPKRLVSIQFWILNTEPLISGVL